MMLIKCSIGKSVNQFAILISIRSDAYTEIQILLYTFIVVVLGKLELLDWKDLNLSQFFHIITAVDVKGSDGDASSELLLLLLSTPTRHKGQIALDCDHHHPCPVLCIQQEHFFLYLLTTEENNGKKQFAQFCKRVVIEAGGDAIVECQISSHS
ncbi:hypothetical protein T03_14792 [Trichinella britovi]|uniref:Uncharacterized protein n=1 Tax=Trichinella britovi TaxID=45882 RepID=A0A0V1CMW4_TRIBR|nr:hypothetical protein T03_14792 [Trichinella britovi]